MDLQLKKVTLILFTLMKHNNGKIKIYDANYIIILKAYFISKFLNFYIFQENIFNLLIIKINKIKLKFKLY